MVAAHSVWAPTVEVGVHPCAPRAIRNDGSLTSGLLEHSELTSLVPRNRPAPLEMLCVGALAAAAAYSIGALAAAVT